MTVAAVAPALRGLLREVASLREDRENLRLHDGRSVEAIVESLEMFGQQKPIVVTPDGTVLAGNGMFRAAKVLGWREVACVTFTGTRDEALAYAIADNRSSERSHWNQGRLEREVAALMTLDPEVVTALGFTEREVARMEASVRAVTEAEQLPPMGEYGADGASGQGEPREAREEQDGAGAPVLTSVLVFSAREPEIEVWYDFLADLRDKYPDHGTVGARLAAYVGGLT